MREVVEQLSSFSHAPGDGKPALAPKVDFLDTQPAKFNRPQPPVHQPSSYHTFPSYLYSANTVPVLVLDFVATGQVRVRAQVGVTIENALLMGS
jgi:hypothetical protein